jgi:palmitoyltransferase ZDHHC9/14/18
MTEPDMSAVPPAPVEPAQDYEAVARLALAQDDLKGKFPGATRILCGGQIITSAASSWLPGTVCLFAVPSIAFAVFVMPDFVRVMSPFWLVPVVVGALFSLTSAFMTAFTDPGILPRRVNPREAIRMDGSTDYGGEPVSLLVYHQSCPDILLGKELSLKGDTAEQRRRLFLKYCGTCEIFRPPRCSHCSYCDNCVEEFDHHCPWVSNCIGRRNYRYFFYFISSTTLLCDGVAAMLGATLHRLKLALPVPDAVEALTEYRLIGVLIVLTGLLGLSLSAMTLYHAALISSDYTTSEQVKRTGGKTGRSCLQNWSRIFCGPRPSRLVQWRLYSRRTSNAAV